MLEGDGTYWPDACLCDWPSLSVAVTAGLPFMSFVMIRICQVTLGVLNHSEDMLGWADPGAITAAHRSLLYSISALISDALNDVASYLSFSR